MKRNNTTGLALIALSLMVLGSSPAIARNHWGNGDGEMWQQNVSALTAEQQTAAQKIDNDYDSQTRSLRQQLTSKQYEYNALLTASSPDSAKISAVAKEMTSLRQSLNDQQVKRDIAMVEAGVPRGTGMGCGGGGYHRGGGHMGIGHW
ncbi:zinc resistance sensor/chaperone ZraP [Citrobacter enshiensis]|uniref:zinc resistance sensor/chaperone ZraP n=1 Tax=Citrobacter enshiensis TaxID=2971264 RepID=UPI0023E7840D|nr:zinc resistance sensor/chaperone ZraP [Citrobacter enshiensis]WET40427.1 zinc resistance sensor/chaperone ZraP [Citrobacter enshiensis]